MLMSMVGKAGRRTLSFLDYATRNFALTWRLLSLAFSREKEGRIMVRRGVVEQIYFTAVQALPIIIPIALIIGIPLVLQLARVSGQYDAGRLAVILVVREVGPILTALVVTLRSATAVTIELGYMSVLREIEALEMAGIDPLRLICLPRLVGITVAIVCLFVVFDVVAIAGSYVLIFAFTDAQVAQFLYSFSQAITGLDIVVSLTKAFCFGIIISVICMFRGLSCKGNFTWIAINTSKASMESFFFCLVANIFITVVFYA
ncbi:ABC transporter permease [Desulfobotulus sp. H1]|uniref:ABC transporter permease n=1 Tax=Desulfobotulus pelophilus TaxID=2823377 RepID=A0ABT3N937_9BACT|nr:ABC transporter permease [Desulfobotulus pelophilus]MCW7753973.1 ABC transporter permease [Desulfobotulus pelophilus]